MLPGSRCFLRVRCLSRSLLFEFISSASRFCSLMACLNVKMLQIPRIAVSIVPQFKMQVWSVCHFTTLPTMKWFLLRYKCTDFFKSSALCLYTERSGYRDAGIMITYPSCVHEAKTTGPSATFSSFVCLGNHVNSVVATLHIIMIRNKSCNGRKEKCLPVTRDTF